MKWIKPSEELPAQGKKILYFLEGDIYVVQRFGDHWFPIPFSDSKYSKLEPPKYWAHIDLPDGFSGKMKVKIEGQIFDIDELEIGYHAEYLHLIKCLLIDFSLGVNING